MAELLSLAISQNIAQGRFRLRLAAVRRRRPRRHAAQRRRLERRNGDSLLISTETGTVYLSPTGTTVTVGDK